MRIITTGSETAAVAGRQTRTMRITQTTATLADRPTIASKYMIRLTDDEPCKKQHKEI